MKFLQGHWTFLGPGSEDKWYGDSHDQKGQWNCTANKMEQRFKEIGQLVFKRTSALSRGILMQRKGRRTIHVNGDSMNRELLFQTAHPANQPSTHGAAANRCRQFGLTEEEKGRVAIPVDNKFLTMVEPEEVDLLVSPPTQALGNSFHALEKKRQLTQLCEKSLLPTSCDRREDVQNSTGWG